MAMNPSQKPSGKPKLAVSTPRTATFPAEITGFTDIRSAVSLPSAISDKTPLSAISRTSAFRDPLPSSGLPSAGLLSSRSGGFPSAGPTSAGLKTESLLELQKTPITPPVAYLDFLKGMTLQSPVAGVQSPTIGMTSPTSKIHPLNRTSTASSTSSTVSTDSSDSIVSTTIEDRRSAEDKDTDSAPTTASSATTDVDCKCEHAASCPNPSSSPSSNLKTQSPPAASSASTITSPSARPTKKLKSPKPADINTRIPMSPLGATTISPRAALQHQHQPLSAPATGATAAAFPSLKVPPSPAVSVLEAATLAAASTDLAAAAAAAAATSPRTPFSGRSLHSPFDWDAAISARRFDVKVAGSPGLQQNGGSGAVGKVTTPIAGTKRGGEPTTVQRGGGGVAGAAASTVRHIREVVTRTVTYTPRVGPAPKGKRRKVDHETAVES